MILRGDCLVQLKKLEARTVQTCVTSPPYWGLRDYGVKGQLGLEKTPEEFVGKLVEVFREVRRVLKDDGTLWLNLGDSYSIGSGKRTNRPQTNSTTKDGVQVRMPRAATPSDHRANLTIDRQDGLKPKDLVGIPWRVAFALQADGWYLRQDIIWHKPNPMPESVTDRCTKAHEYIFLLSKSARYYFDHEAIKEPAVTATGRPNGKVKSPYGQGFTAGRSGNKVRTFDHTPRKGVGAGVPWEGVTRNKRSVWTVTTKPFKGAHFATFPPDLIEPCVLAGAPLGGMVLDPFAGAGTVGLVCKKHDRDFIGIELNKDYRKMALDRIKAA